MTTYTVEQYNAGIQKAIDAGDTEGARVLKQRRDQLFSARPTVKQGKEFEKQAPLTGADVAKTWEAGGAGVKRGAMDIAEGVGQLGTRGLAALSPEGTGVNTWAADKAQAIDEYRKKAVGEYETKYGDDPSARFGRVLGQTAVTAGPMSLLRVGGPVARAALQSGTAGAVSPVDDTTNYWQEKAKQTAMGTTIGAGVGLAGKAAGHLANPRLNKRTRMLLKEDVKPTVGQMYGGNLLKAEERAKSYPFIGGAIRKRQEEALANFNKATINRALRPIRTKIDDVGYEGYRKADEIVSKRYEKLMPKLTTKYDDQFAIDLEDLSKLAQNLPPEQRSLFNDLVQREVRGKISKTGYLLGTEIKKMESELGRIAKGLRGDQAYYNRELGNAVLELQQGMRRMLARRHPQHAAELRKINTAYARLERVRRATKSAGADADGVFTPRQYRSAVRSAEEGPRGKAFAKGQALEQDWANAGVDRIGQQGPNSWSTDRLLSYAAPGAAIYTGQIAPYAAATALGTGLYSRPAQGLLRGILGREPGRIAKGTARAIEEATPVVSVFGTHKALEE